MIRLTLVQIALLVAVALIAPLAADARFATEPSAISPVAALPGEALQ